MEIVALDLGKSKTVVCYYDIQKHTHRFRTVLTRPHEIHDAIISTQAARVVLEIGSQAGWVVDMVRALGIEVQVANTNDRAWLWKKNRNKTDRLDALRLAQLSALGRIPQVHIPKADVRQWRSLIAYRHTLVERRTQIKNNIRAIFDRQGLLLPATAKCWTKEGLLLIQQEAKRLQSCMQNELWRGMIRLEMIQFREIQKLIAKIEAKLNALAAKDKRIQILQSAAGVGPRLAEAVVACIDDPHRFKNGKQVGSYIGLTPRQFQSGSMDRQGGISGWGNKLLRSLLVEVSWIGLRFNPWMRTTYERLMRNSKARKKIAIVALARKLLVRCWAMLRDMKPWYAPPIPEPVVAA
jgi:transposase